MRGSRVAKGAAVQADRLEAVRGLPYLTLHDSWKRTVDPEDRLYPFKRLNVPQKWWLSPRQ
jgi:hypothetical protein